MTMKNSVIVNILKYHKILNSLWNHHIKLVLYLVLNVSCEHRDSIFHSLLVKEKIPNDN